jgi:hypothetical protein
MVDVGIVEMLTSYLEERPAEEGEEEEELADGGGECLTVVPLRAAEARWRSASEGAGGRSVRFGLWKARRGGSA